MISKKIKKGFGPYIEFFREVFELEVILMYSRVTNMHRIEYFGTISNETSLQIQCPPKKIIIISSRNQ